MNSPFEGRSQRAVLLLFLAGALYACYLLVKPFLQPIILAILIGMLASPAHQRLVRVFRGRKNIATLVSCLVLSALFLVPILLVMVAVLKQGYAYSVIVRDWATQDNIQQFMAQPWVLEIQSRVTRVLPEGALSADNIRARALEGAGFMGRHFADVSASIIGSVSRFMINAMLLVFVLYFVLRDQDELIAFLHRALPLSNSQEVTLFREVRAVSKTALMGSLLTAATQGFVGGFGLWLAGFPGLFWGTVMAFASLIPFVGTTLIWVPAALFLAVTGQWGWAIFMVVWGIVVVGSIDNFLRPLFMQGASMSTVVIFFSLLGGLQLFGLIGLIYGPLIVAIALVLFKLYETEFAGFLDQQDRR